MATTGPPPKRSDQRRRRNKADGPSVEHAHGASVVVTPEPSASWHPTAALWFSSLGESGQSHFYEPSDWALAYLVADLITAEFATGEPPKAASVAAWLKAMGSLMVAEGDRRRVRLELDRPTATEDDVEVSELDAYRARLRSS